MFMYASFPLILLFEVFVNSSFGRNGKSVSFVKCIRICSQSIVLSQKHSDQLSLIVTVY